MPKLISQSLVLFMLGLMTLGCGQKPPAPAAAPPDSTPPSTTLTPTPGSEAAGAGDKSNTAAVNPPVVPAKPLVAATPKVAVDATTFPDAAFLGDDVVGLVVVHPRKITAWPVYKMAKDAGLMEDFEQQIQGFNVKPESVERVTLVVDQTSINSTAKSVGLKVIEGDTQNPGANTTQLKNQLKQIGLAFHNYHDSYRRFPRADGDGDGMKTGLSWRVHLLPFLEEIDLYEQFHLDEPWDSDHNKTLIEQMPAAFETPGVDAGKTAMHVFIGKGTPFDGDKGLSIRDFTDGTSNTLLAVLAGADTAEAWTKPGGLKFDAKEPKKALGEITDKSFLGLMADGSTHPLAMDLEDQTLANLIQLNDGNVVDFDRSLQREPAPAVPAVILSLTTPADQPEIVTSILFEAEEETFEGQTLHKNESSAVWFADEKTVVCGPIETVKKMITRKLSGTPGKAAALSQLEIGSDLTMAFELQSQSELLQQAVQGNPIMGLALQVKSVALQMNVSGKPGDKLLEVVATASNEQMANTLSQLAQGGLAQGKQSLTEFPLPEDATDDDKAAHALALRIVKSAAINQVGDRIEFLIPVPEGYEKLPELLKPALEKARAAAEQAKKQNSLKQIALAFHNYHDVFGSLPGAGRPANPMGKAGLSWRVHLLPFLEGQALYEQFNLDEPWDSEQNKALIEQMPELFKTEGVTEPGKTSLHVFTGCRRTFRRRCRAELCSVRRRDVEYNPRRRSGSQHRRHLDQAGRTRL